ncbi:MAG: O-antigen ligase family protein [Pirellulaceae bacterium]|nr:O-antigen ligase family protein [Pirellulaceae bacterium]
MNLRYVETATVDSPTECAEQEIPGTREQQRWFDAMCILLLGYAIFGKGFAYIGIPPLFVGELLLISGLYLFLRFGSWRYVIGHPAVWALMAVAVWGTVTTIPHVDTYGIDAVRDAMIWGYAAFALLVMGSLLADPSRLPRLVERYEVFAILFLLAIPVTSIVSQLELAPNWPWVNVAMVDVKSGDVLVHLAGIFAFWASDLGRPARIGWILLLLVCVAVMGAVSRGGLVAVLAASGICMMFRPFSPMLWSVISASVFGLLVLAVIDVKFDVPGKDREFSAQQIVEGILSVVESSEDKDLDSTKQWRIRWWTDIVNYTWNGDYFWMGKGFGINLADSDGYQGTQWQGQLRSPHNGHFTMLARAGVPGFVLWIIPQALWFCLLLTCSLKSQISGQRRWNSLFVFLLAYWAALILRATFDVFLEGPVGGIWFWAIYGIGLSATVIYRYCPEIFNEQEVDDEDSSGA